MPTVYAPAKLNLALHVVGQRDDGYHELDSLVAFVDVGDRLDFKPARTMYRMGISNGFTEIGPAGDTEKLAVYGDFADQVPQLSENSVGAALKLLRRWGKDPLVADNLHIVMHKTLPVAAGVGGGSADAAATIRALASRPLSHTEIEDCLALGADVPMCLESRPARVSGIGEIAKKVWLPETWAVLVNPKRAVLTPTVFNKLTQKNNRSLPDHSRVLTFSDLIDYLRGTRNDLLEPALEVEPEIATVLRQLSDAPFAQMSGSGATCFALFPDAVSALEFGEQLYVKYPEWWVQAGALHGTVRTPLTDLPLERLPMLDPLMQRHVSHPLEPRYWLRLFPDSELEQEVGL